MQEQKWRTFMADGIICEHCGFQETDHTMDPERIKGSGKKQRGKKKTLRTCPGYEPEDKQLAAELQREFDEEERARLKRQFGGFKRD